MVQLVTSSRLENAFMALEFEGSQVIVSATDSKLEGLELVHDACEAFSMATPVGSRTAVLSGDDIPTQVDAFVPEATTNLVVGAIISPTGTVLGYIALYGSEEASDADQVRIRNSIDIVERHLDDKQEHSSQRATGMSLKIAGDKLQRYSEKLKFENENLDLFAEFTAHEVKNPLRAIMLCSDFLRVKLNSGSEDLTTDEIVSMLGQISEEAQVLYEQIENILALGKPEVEYRRAQLIDLGEVAQQCFQRYAAELSRVGGRMEIGSMVTVACDPAQLLMVMSNLVSNAIRYRSPERTLLVTIDSYVTEDRTIILVADNGIGIESHDQQRIFDAYTRCSPDLPGLGLGLALSLRSLEQVGGSIDVVSQPGQGSTFAVSLAKAPLAESAGT